MSDRRKDTRTEEENKVVIEFVSCSEGRIQNEEAYALTKDISVGGAKIITDCYFPVGSFFKMNVALSRSRQSIQVEGTVKWVKSIDGDRVLYETGVEFLHDIPDTVFALLTHVFQIEKGIPTLLR
jgi:hypothetical protein